MSAIPASSMITRLFGPIVARPVGQVVVGDGPGSLARVSVGARSGPATGRPRRRRGRGRRLAAGAGPGVGEGVHGGGLAGAGRGDRQLQPAPEVAIARTKAAWPASRSTPFAVISSNATSTLVSGMVRPSVRPAEVDEAPLGGQHGWGGVQVGAGDGVDGGAVAAAEHVRVRRPRRSGRARLVDRFPSTSAVSPVGDPLHLVRGEVRGAGSGGALRRGRARPARSTGGSPSPPTRGRLRRVPTPHCIPEPAYASGAACR